MADAELLREALEALEDPALNTQDLRRRIARRLPQIHARVRPSAADEVAEPSPDSTIPILPVR